MSENPEKLPSIETTKTDLIKAEIYDKFQAIFGGVYNVIELAVEDTNKAEKAKDLIGGILIRARESISQQMDFYNIK